MKLVKDHSRRFVSSNSPTKSYSETSFHISSEAVTWFEANNLCRRQFDAPLFDPTSDPVDISMAEDYVAHIRGQVGGGQGEDDIEAVWTGVVDDEGRCQVRELLKHQIHYCKLQGRTS